MSLVIDTSRLVDFFKGDETVRLILQAQHDIRVPFAVLGELRAGFLCGTRSLENERLLSRFLNSKRVQVEFADEDTSHHYARIFKTLRSRGTPIPTNDLWIASLCIQHNRPLLTRDQHFEKIPQLAIETG